MYSPVVRIGADIGIQIMFYMQYLSVVLVIKMLLLYVHTILLRLVFLLRFIICLTVTHSTVIL
ncbi:hypothetical protein DN052_08115 [Acidithiobacillus ferrooxidans]|uniref:Uncharacterized protein n=1 Tax=Acidithiobacillus ferrooxidans TaxID=920 RepID=A0A2W1K439_ACIFR|nr:hypothetical protein DN052_08115 [Acidithiobacillus ferrooxidans]